MLERVTPAEKAGFNRHLALPNQRFLSNIALRDRAGLPAAVIILSY
jgi:hypothetical protein